MKKLLLALLLFVSDFVLQAQTYGNEWIDYSRVHYKIKVTQDGFYRVPYATLAATIPNVGAINPNNLVLYHNGQKVPIYITNTTSLGPSDYIEFYGKKNIGDVDSMLYSSGSKQSHVYHSLFTDTSVYFLTTNGQTNNPRFAEVSNNLSNLPPKEEYIMAQSRLVLANPSSSNSYMSGKYYSVGSSEVYKSTFEDGEGFTNNVFFGSVSSGGSTPQQVNQILSLSTPGIYAGGPDATFKTSYVNNSNEFHDIKIFINNNQVLAQSTFGFKLNKLSQTVPLANLTNGNNSIVYSTYDQSLSKRQNSVSYLELDYPRVFDFNAQNSFYFQIAADAANKKYLEISNFNDNGTQPVLYDLTNGIFYRSTQASGSSPIKYQILASPFKREMLLRSNDNSSVNIVSQITPVSFINYSSAANQGNYLIISNTKLFNDGNGNNRVEEYRQYRDVAANPSSGKYTARIVDIDQLYDQFAYGIRKSPLSIRNFIEFAKNTWTNIQPEHVFLIGKGREYPDTRTGGSGTTQCLVPTFGYPGSDNLLAATRNSDFPTVSIGRLAAETGDDVALYLQKIREYETEQNLYSASQAIAPKLWQKQVLHFSGGTGLNEQNLFKYYLQNYKGVVQDTLWGANVTTFSKTDNNPISQSLSQIIRNQIEAGTSLITFFGHSATGAFDFSIDEPENYTNFGKYPVILSNGCFAGFIHDVNQGYSERFVLLPDKGAIAFIATSSLSTSSGLDKFSSKFYLNNSNNTYQSQLGKTLQQSASDLLSDPGATDFDKMVAFEMTLHGDPGILMNQYPKPDYAIEASSVYFNPANVTPGLDSFDVNVIVTNLGKAIDDSISVTLRRTIFDANNNPFVYNMQMNVVAPYYIDTATFKVPVNISTLGYGQNLFEPYVEAGFKIDEMAEQNNGLLAPVSVYIQNDDILPIYPYEFAIVPQQGVTLKASTINPFAPERNYKLQIDTSELFQNPLESTVIYQGGGVVHWTPTITYTDSTVYYWRVGKDSAGAAWHYSSFIYLANEYQDGWNQSHYYQWLKDDYVNLSLDNDRIFRFPPTTNEIHVLTGNGLANNPNFENLGWDYNNSNEHRWRMGGCGYLNGLTFAVIDTTLGLPLESINTDGNNFGDKFSNVHCSYQYFRQNGFDFPTTGNNANLGEPWSQTIKRFIDSIPSGSYVLMYSVNQVPFTNWDTTLVQTLQSLGFAQAQLFKSGAINGPLVFFTQKGNVNYNPFFAYKLNYNVPLDTSFTFIGKWNSGNFTSPKIGPAVEWVSVHWNRQPLNAQFTDRDSLDIYGVRVNGIDTLLLTTANNNNFISNIDAAVYPYLKLRLRSTDDSIRTPTQLDYWRVLYKKPPEAAINPAAWFKFSESLNLGQSLHLEIALENVTNVNMDSMQTKYTIRDVALTTQNYYIRYDSLRGLDTMILVFDIPVNSTNYAGLNRLILEANPDNDQIEQYHFNNFAEIEFTSVADKINPLLDVTFDGQHIFNGDIVSGKPNILIVLKDENKYLALNDTSLMNVYLKFPGESIPRRMNFDDVVMKFYPADSTNLNKNNRAQIELKPTLNTDGTYELLVKDRDRMGNNSSSSNLNESNVFYDYKTTFEVINKAMITNVLNYPNPFTTATKFVFTITGTELPDIMKIQIMTIKGTVVKEIFKEELGALRIGRNITEYTWDGRDSYGDLLANGVYFYRVVTRMDNQAMDHLSQSYDKYFKKGFGKMVIIR